MLVFTLFVTFGSSLSVPKGILFFVLGLIISAIAFYIMNINIPVAWDSCWLSIAPFIAIMVLCSVILGWDIYLPFLICGMFSVALSAASKQIRKDSTKPDSQGVPSLKSFFSVLIIFGTAAASALLFVCICGFVEVFI